MQCIKIMKNSKQRNKLLEILSEKNYHPTVDELYLIIKKEFPNLSLATVYRNLEQLVQNGAVVKIEQLSGPARYDGNPERHLHIKCTKCGKIEDVWVTIDLKLFANQAEEVTGYKVTGYKIDFYGVCDKCINRI